DSATQTKQNIELQSANAFGSWLKRIVVNKAINQLNKKSIQWSQKDVEVIEKAEEIEEELPWADLTVSDVKSAMKELSHGYKVVFSLFMFEGLSHAEIANSLNITESTSKSQLNRAKKRIKENLEKSWK
ncbi:MAG: RNA polymerase sigma factor, partial [Flavobacteriales bacterium]